MCGIVGVLGRRPAVPLLLDGLQRLEYRGYDSAGLAVLDHGVIRRVRSVGPVERLARTVRATPLVGTAGIAHTRWATHGAVTEANTHPLTDCTGAIAIAHNGIIENHAALRAALARSHRYTSATDSEVLAHLVEERYRGDLVATIREVLHLIRGASAFVVLHAAHPRLLVAARAGCPLVVGIGRTSAVVASDPMPLRSLTRTAVFLEDGELAAVRAGHVDVVRRNGSPVRRRARSLAAAPVEAGVGDTPHAMLREIREQPGALQAALDGRLDFRAGTARLEALRLSPVLCRSIRRVHLVACGTAHYATLIGATLLERLAGVPAVAEMASEFVARQPRLDRRVLVLAVSQSGETADTRAAVRVAARQGATIRSLVNVEESSLARETAGCIPLRAGPERAVASTKAYTNMIAVLALLALGIGRARGLSRGTGQRLLQELTAMPERLATVIAADNGPERIAGRLFSATHCLFLGRGLNYPVALEGALKLTEVSYIHGQGLAAGEMKHGANALLGPDLPVVVISTRNALLPKMRNAMAEVTARGSPVFAVITAGDEETQALAADTLAVPEMGELLEPILTTVPLQLLAYAVGVRLGRDIDRPRNLAKSVTVE